MKTLALLAALLLLALQAQARTLQETADQVPAQDQPEAMDQGELWAEDQDQAEDGDQDVAISFTGEERLSRAADPQRRIVCTCRSGNCVSGERLTANCYILGRKYNRCCK